MPDRIVVVCSCRQELCTLLYDLLMLGISDSEKEMTNEYSSNEKPTHEVSRLYHGVCLFKTCELF